MMPHFFTETDGAIVSSRVERGYKDVQNYGKLEWVPCAYAQRTSNRHFPRGGGCPNYMCALQNAEQNRDSVEVRMANQRLKGLWVALAPVLPLAPVAPLAWPEDYEFWIKFGAQFGQLQFLEFAELRTKLHFQYCDTRILAQDFWLKVWEP